MRYIDLSKNITPEDIKYQIEKIQKIQLSIENYHLILHEVGELLLSNSLLLNVMMKAPEKVYRARKYNISDIRDFPPKNVKQLWYKKAEIVDKLGRLNLINQSIFYCGNSNQSVIFELMPKNNEVIVVVESQLINKESPPNFIMLGLDKKLNNICKVNAPNALKDITSIQESMQNTNSLFSGVTDRHVDGYNIINDFIFHEFTKQVRTNYEQEYLISIAISQLLLSPPKYFIIDGIDGIVYPSINSNINERSFSDINIGMLPSIVDFNYEPINVKAFHVTNIKPDNDSTEIECVIADPIKELKSNGNIIWE